MTPPSHHPPDWIEIVVRSDPDTHETVSDFLVEGLGCEGVLFDASGKALKAYVPGGTAVDPLRSRIESFLSALAAGFPHRGKPSYRLSRIQDQDWGTAWRKHFRPEQVTPGLLVLPAWESPPRDLRGRLLRMDPGPAFGTGNHPTTRMCLQALEDLSPDGGWSLLDVGTGSGILAMYGALLGAAPVEAVDVDEEALRWAAWNLELNGLTRAVRLSGTPLQGWERTFFVVTANLELKTIQGLIPGFSRVVAAGGTLVLSGLLRTQVPRVTPDLARSGFRLVREMRAEEWSCVLADRPARNSRSPKLGPETPPCASEERTSRCGGSWWNTLARRKARSG